MLPRYYCYMVVGGAFAQAKNTMLGLSALYPTRLSVNVEEYPTRDEYMEWLTKSREVSKENVTPKLC
jgi:hypothetical protein